MLQIDRINIKKFLWAFYFLSVIFVEFCYMEDSEII